MALTHEELWNLLHYDDQTGKFTWKNPPNNFVKTGATAGSTNKDGYVYIRVAGRKFKAHRLAWLYVTGEWPTEQVDHINGTRDDNKFANLRQATNSENQRNSKKRRDNTSGFKGVQYLKRDHIWRAKITIHGKTKYLGQFPSAEEAHAAYCVAAQKYHGEFANP